VILKKVGVKMAQIFVMALLAALGYVVWKYRAMQKVFVSLSISDKEIQTTLVSGLYHRFKNEEGVEKETPFDFEDFVAKVLEEYYGGVALATQRSGDGGIDIRHTRNGVLYLGQVKCYAPGHQVPFDPIAIVHSQIVKEHAAGGYVITTSDFTQAAKNYAQEINVNIELIDGSTFVRYWAEAVEAKRAGNYKEPMRWKFRE
jgi:restriction system protein